MIVNTRPCRLKPQGAAAICSRLNRFGFPRGYLMRPKTVKGFQAGDLVKAEVAICKKAGVHVGRVVIRKTGNFNILMPEHIVQGIG